MHVVPLSPTEGVSVAFNGRLSLCRPQAGCNVTRAGAPQLRTLRTWTTTGGVTSIIGTSARVTDGRPRGEGWLVSPTGDPMASLDFGAMTPIDVAVDSRSGLLIVAGALRAPYRIGPLAGQVWNLPLVGSYEDRGPLLPRLPDVVVVYDPIARRAVRRDPLPVGTIAAIGVR